MRSGRLRVSTALAALALVIALAAGVPVAAAAPSLTCTGMSPGGGGILNVAVSGTSSVSDSLKVTASGGNYALSLTSGGLTTPVCTTYPDSGVSGFPTVEVTGSTQLPTTFVLVDPGLTFVGQSGVSNTLDLSSTTSPLVLVANGAVLSGAGPDSFSNITTFKGSAGGNTDFVATNAGGYTFNAAGSGNALDLRATGSGVTVSAPAGTVTGLASAGTDHFSGISTIAGSGSGNTTMVAGATALTFLGQGTGNELDLSQVPTSQFSPLHVNLSGFPVGGVFPNTAAVSTTTYQFNGVSTFVGAATGNTTFLAGTTGGYTFDGGGSGNVLDLSAAGPGVSVSLATHTVSVPSTSSDNFAGISTFNGLGATFIGGSTPGYTFNGAGNGNTFIPGSGSGTFNGGLGFANTVDFSGVATSQGTPLKVNLSGVPIGVVNPGTAVVGGTTYAFSGVTAFSGATTGNTDFIASGTNGGYSFGFAGSGDTLDLSMLPAATTVSVGTVLFGGHQDTFSGTTAINGSALGFTTFTPNATGGYAFNGTGTGNTLDLIATGPNVTASVPNGTLTMNSGSDEFSGISFFVGSSSGGTTLQAGATALTFQGKGVGNELDFSQVFASGAAPFWVNATGGPVASFYGTLAANHAESGFATYAFDDVKSFFGPVGGNTTFAAGSTGGFSFVDLSPNNVLDLSSAGSGVSVTTGTVSGLTGGTDTYAGIKTVIGPAAGGATFTGGSGGSSSGYTFNGGGNGNTFIAGSGTATFNGGVGFANKLDFSAVSTFAFAPLQVNVSGSPVGPIADSTAAVGTTTYHFNGIATFNGAVSGNTTFFAGPTGGYTLNGGGSANTLDLGAKPTAVVTVNGDSLADPGTVTGLTSGTDSFSDIQSFTPPQVAVYYRLSVTKLGNGTGGVTSSPAGIDCGSTCSHDFLSGIGVTLTAVATPGSTFAGWSGACAGTGICSVGVTATSAVSATFTLLPSYTLSVAKSGSGAGTVTSLPAGIDCGSACSQGYTSGTSVTLTAVAAAGSTFAGWSGACTGTGGCSVSMTAATALTATFALTSFTPPTFTLSVVKSGNGAGRVTSAPAGIDCGSTCSKSFTSGASVTLTAAAAAGSTFEGWTGACTGTSACTVAMTAARSVAASFRKSCVVPKVKGKSLKAAERLIKAHGCSVGKIGHAFSTTVKKGSVVSQKPRPGQRRAPGAKVSLVVSKGRRK